MWFFFRKCDVFVKSPKKIFQITILNVKFKFPVYTVDNLFKFQAQDSYFGIFV